MRERTPATNAASAASVRVRPATADDLPAVMALVQRVIPRMHADGLFQWDQDYPDRQVFAGDIGAGELWVAEPEPGVVGGVIAIGTEQYHEYEAVGWDIHEPAIVAHRLAVDPAYRGAGLAAALMRQAETVARRRGIAILRVDTSTQNVAAQRLVTRLGYRLAGEASLGFRGGMRIFCYQKQLERVPE